MHEYKDLGEDLSEIYHASLALYYIEKKMYQKYLYPMILSNVKEFGHQMKY